MGFRLYKLHLPVSFHLAEMLMLRLKVQLGLPIQFIFTTSNIKLVSSTNALENVASVKATALHGQKNS